MVGIKVKSCADHKTYKCLANTVNSSSKYFQKAGTKNSLGNTCKMGVALVPFVTCLKILSWLIHTANAHSPILAILTFCLISNLISFCTRITYSNVCTSWSKYWKSGLWGQICVAHKMSLSFPYKCQPKYWKKDMAWYDIGSSKGKTSISWYSIEGFQDMVYS